MLITASQAEAALQVGLEGPEMAMTEDVGELPANPVVADGSENDLQMKDVSSNASSSPSMLGVDAVSMPVVDVRRLNWKDDAVNKRFWPLLMDEVPKAI